MYDIEKIRADFPILSRKQGRYPYTYLDSGATAQKPTVVIDRVNELHRSFNANIHRGSHELSDYCTTAYEGAREDVRRFIGAASTKEIIFTSGATASLNLVAYSYGEKFIHKGDIIVISEMEHHANIVPWQLLAERKGAIIRVIPFNSVGELILDDIDTIITEGVKVVAVTEVSNVLGTRNDVKSLAAKAHSVGAVIVVDGCQGVVHGGIDVVDADIDFYAFSGHKLYSPTGVGVLYGKRELLESMPPFFGGGDMVARVSFTNTTYAELPLKFEAGTTPFTQAIAMSEAIKYIEGLGVENIIKHEKMVLDYATKELKKLGYINFFGESHNKSSIISFNVQGIHPYDLGMVLNKMGVAIRTGNHCAEPIISHYGVDGMARASFALYSSVEDVDNFIKAVERAVLMFK